MKYKYGTDAYGRFAEDKNGERYFVEFYPFWRRYPWRIRHILFQAYYVLAWHIGVRRQGKEYR